MPGATSDDELSLRRSSSSYHFALNSKLDFELRHTRGSNNLSRHHSFDLMSSPIDYIFMNSLDKCVMITIYILMLFQDINWINDEKYHPCPRWVVLSSSTLLPSLQHKLVHVLCYTLSSLLSSNCSSLPWSITIFYVKKVVRITPPLKTSWYGDTSHPHHSFLVTVLILTGIPTREPCCLDSVLLATLLLWS